MGVVVDRIAREPENVSKCPDENNNSIGVPYHENTRCQMVGSIESTIRKLYNEKERFKYMNAYCNDSNLSLLLV